jgi:hypothetical protein
MRFEGIDFPKPIIEAQEKGELVIFAGAGVSIPSPSDLPDFKKLANELANDIAVLKGDEPIDRFLGRLPPTLNIHERTRIKLKNPAPCLFPLKNRWMRSSKNTLRRSSRWVTDNAQHLEGTFCQPGTNLPCQGVYFG